MRRMTVACLALLSGTLSAQTPYKTPPQIIVDILDAPPLPAASISPDRQWLLLLEQRSMPTIAELAQPMLRLAGNRINPRTSGPQLPGGITGLVLKRVADGTERRVNVPTPAALSYVILSPDSRTVAFVQTSDSGLVLWVADAATGQTRALTGATLNATSNPPCQWMPSSTSLLCEFIPEARGPAPVAPQTPVGPTTQETRGRAAPAPTFEDLLKNHFDEQLFDYYFTSQLAYVDAATGARTPIGKPAIFERVDVSPGGEHVLIARSVRPFSYLVPSGGFPQEIEVWNVKGDVVHHIATLPSSEGVPIRGVRTGPRAFNWRPGTPATLVWAEALDGGDPRTKVEHQDRIVTLAAPFTAEPTELARLVKRYAGLAWDTQGIGFLQEYDRERRWVKTWIVDATKPGTAPVLLFDRSAEERYSDPGFPLMRMTPAGDFAMQRSGDWIYFTGTGASPQGDRPFLDRLSLTTRKTERLWRADTVHYEAVVALLDDAAKRFVTRRESRTEPPNDFVRQGTRLRALTAFKDPAPQLTGIQKRLLTYTREDGVPLSGTVYLPPGYTPGTRLPVVMWAYPIEFASASAAGQVSAAPNRFNIIRGPSHLFFLTQGYAVLDDPKMPIIGGDTANNHYVEQLVMSARAAVKAVVDAGVGDADRIGIGGHSYGASINEPILMTHGEADNNSGTFPINSERLFAAIKGLGGTARLVMLPNEAHGYIARESVLHTLAEMIDWFDRYVKNAPPRSPGVSSGVR